jgi:chromosome segregation ATPase
VRQLKAELDDSRSSSAAPTERDAARIAELERLLGEAQYEVQRRAERLHAVEEQVSQAVGKLQEVHLDLHTQSELATTRANIIYQVGRLLEAPDGTTDPAVTLAQIRAAIAPRQ